ncbi:unnamed protein product [Pseudo-nitzschia multistriata]|uniref:Uncharacterized protein n=1 Tax=Pseudo-nitzschia multistriata TaxID=183589 RepID=A0A448Z043_9STRA|nr:unnamed protein product [Pseudo-nitzschia multistriata]
MPRNATPRSAAATTEMTRLRRRSGKNPDRAAAAVALAAVLAGGSVANAYVGTGPMAGRAAFGARRRYRIPQPSATGLPGLRMAPPSPLAEPDSPAPPTGSTGGIPEAPAFPEPGPPVASETATGDAETKAPPGEEEPQEPPSGSDAPEIDEALERLKFQVALLATGAVATYLVATTAAGLAQQAASALDVWKLAGQIPAAGLSVLKGTYGVLKVVLPAVGSAGKAAYETAAPAIGGAIEAATPVLQETAERVAEVATPVLQETASRVAEVAAPVIEETARTVNEAAAPYVDQVASTVQGAQEQVIGQVQQAQEQVIGQVQQAQQQVAGQVQQAAAPYVDQVASTVQGAQQQVAGQVQQAQQQVAGQVQQAQQQVAGQVQQAQQQVAGQVQQAVSGAAEAVGGALETTAKEAGRAFETGVLPKDPH